MYQGNKNDENNNLKPTHADSEKQLNWKLFECNNIQPFKFLLLPFLAFHMTFLGVDIDNPRNSSKGAATRVSLDTKLTKTMFNTRFCI